MKSEKNEAISDAMNVLTVVNAVPFSLREFRG